jgi:hypothetical protein
VVSDLEGDKLEVTVTLLEMLLFDDPVSDNDNVDVSKADIEGVNERLTIVVAVKVADAVLV